MDIPCLSVHKHKKTDEIVIVNFAVEKEFGFCVAYGELVRVRDESLPKDGIGIVLENLRGFAKRDSSQPAEIDGMPKAQREAFDRDYHEVGISLRNKGAELWLSPMEPGTRGGKVGEPEKRIVVKLPCDNSKFYERLCEAFERCG